MESIRDVTFAALTTAALPWLASTPITEVEEVKIFVSPTEISQTVSTWSGFVSVADMQADDSAWLDRELGFWVGDSTKLMDLMSQVSDELDSAMASTLSIETEDDAFAWATALVQSANR
jgi:hypothetical protein